MIEIITGSIFNAKEKYIAHQCNCVTNRAAHLAKDMFAQFPHADIYSGRTSPDKPGDIIIKGNGDDQRYVIAMLGQYYPGFSKYPTSKLDGIEARENYFYRALLRIAKITDLESIAFPWKIGCGAAGGDWKRHLGNLENFAKYVEQSQNTKVVIYQREEDK
jgi:O-acetyl-ADP-ribose deacetylase (regulator of RNase III)